MKARTLLSTVLLTFVGVSIVYAVVDEIRSTPSAPAGNETSTHATAPTGAAPAEPVVAAPPKQLLAYYFHRTQRCRKCLTIERFTKEALEEAFPEALAAGQLEWHVVNLDEPGTGRFIADYELSTSSVVFVEYRDGTRHDWRRLDRVWELTEDELKFKSYIEGQALAYLELEL